MKHKKFLTLLVVLMVASMTLAACAPAATEAPPAETEEAVEPTEAPPEPEPTEAPPEPEPTEEPMEEPTEEPMEEGPVAIIIGVTDAISSLDPADAYATHDWELIKNMGEGLLKWAPGTAELSTGLAVDFPEISEDGLVYTFKLREGITFGDGLELTAPMYAEQTQPPADHRARLPEWCC